MTLDDLLTMMHQPADREEFLRLGGRYNDNRVRRERVAAADAGADVASEAEQQELLRQMMEQVQWHLRAARHPLPEPSELEHMIAEYFQQ